MRRAHAAASVPHLQALAVCFLYKDAVHPTILAHGHRLPCRTDYAMRRYLQGTLDFFCGTYAVVNALAVVGKLELPQARHILQETLLEVSLRPRLWSDLLANRTDHYWLVRFLAARRLAGAPHHLRCIQPFDDCLLPCDEAADLESARSFLPEEHPPHGPASIREAEEESVATWSALADWFTVKETTKGKRAAVLRFHRFLPGLAEPVVSHWTTARAMENETLILHDASSERQAVHSIQRDAISASGHTRAPLRIVPESILLLESLR